MITKCWTETRDGFDICLFKCQGLEGQYSVSGTVTYNPNAFYRAEEAKVKNIDFVYCLNHILLRELIAKNQR